ncbi:MAG: nucleoside hydrolase [Chloroflexi bacterium]|nr:MAG: nucleoside hydrolase [Chloroflexota bacterium]
MTRKIIIDTDPGIDDAMAVLFALKSPELSVIGLTTVFGNVYTTQGTENALYLLDVAGRPDIPVAQGAERPLVLPPRPPADFVHGKDGLGNLPPFTPRGQPDPRPAARFIVDTVSAFPGEVTLVALGPLTNLALALALEPRLVEMVAEVVLMGGAVTVSGNVNPAAEANIWNDPHAAEVVFSAGWPVTMVGLDVTTQVVMTDEYLAGLNVTGAPDGEFVYRISRFYVDFHRRYYNLNGAHTHDPSAIACVVDPSLFTTFRGPVRVVTEGIAAGQTILDRHQQWFEPTPWSNRPPVKVCLGVDAPRLLALYRQRILA